ncbi:DUF6538 domain-containing protein [uncultured Ferrimonas sp.]|uniref:DUF6538 domain-containing protein n=1 Tax=uncultured Ferrimonas sp. TaxID=432640 RepID=UPI00341D3010
MFQSRHGVWYARLVVPLNLRASLGCRELRKPFNTKCRIEATKRSWCLLLALNDALSADSDKPS